MDDSGIGRYIRLLVNNILRIDREHAYAVLVPPGRVLDVPTDDLSRVKFVQEPAGNYSFREATWLSLKLWNLRPSLVHEPHYAGPIIRPWKTVVTVQDVIHAKFPEYTRSFGRRIYVRAMLNRAIRSDRVIVSSNHTRKDLMEMGADPERIRVIPFAADPVFAPPLSAAEAQLTARTLGATKPYIIYVGMWKSHKNVGMLLRVFKRLLSDGNWDGQLVLVGSLQGAERWLEVTKDMGLAGRVVFAGSVPDHELADLYAAAQALVHPSSYEGFGLTLLEAMATGTPVIALRNSSIPEVCGDAAILVGGSGDDAEGHFYHAVNTVLTDARLRHRLSEEGLQRAARFSWEKTASETLGVYDELSKA